MTRPITTPEITLLTLPVPDGPHALQQRLWLTGRRLNYWRKGQRPPRYSGHYAVTRSLVEGMVKAALPVNHNPQQMTSVAERVHVPGGVHALRQAILMKQRGDIKQLTCGPNIAVLASDHDSILQSPEIDAVVNHTEDAMAFWRADAPELRYLLWAAGVDPEFWRPGHSGQRDRILIFDKHVDPGTDPARILPYVAYLESLGYGVDILRRNDSEGEGYTAQTFLSLLQSAALMVGFTMYHGESQGIAWAEAWSTDVPTLILSKEGTIYEGRPLFLKSAPFLTPSTGALFDNFGDFQHQFDLWRHGLHAFRPRQWVLEHMSDEVSARDLYNKLMNLPQHLVCKPAMEDGAHGSNFELRLPPLA